MEFKFTLLDALQAICRDWEQVSDSMTKKCFAKAKIIEKEIKTEPGDAELLEILEALRSEDIVLSCVA